MGRPHFNYLMIMILHLGQYKIGTADSLNLVRCGPANTSIAGFKSSNIPLEMDTTGRLIFFV